MEEMVTKSANPEPITAGEYPLDINYTCGRYSPEQKKYMIELLNKARIVCDSTGAYINICGTDIPLNIFPERARCPVLISVIGAGRSGKNTFTQFVKKMMNKIPNFHLVEDVDIVGPVKKAADVLMQSVYDEGLPISDYLNIYNPHMIKPSIAAETKPDAYRQLLADIKNVWFKYYQAPVMYAIYHIIKLVDDAKKRSFPNTSKNNDLTSIVFLQNRDQYTIDLINEICENIGIIHFVLKVESEKITSANYENTCDSSVDNIPYDVLIKNIADIRNLAQIAESFTQIFAVANCIYGVDLCTGDDPQIQNLITKVQSAFPIIPYPNV